MPRRKQKEVLVIEISRLKNVIAVLEKIRKSRNEIKRFSVTLEDMYLEVPSYHNALYKAENTRLFTREELIILCRRLECNSTEMNTVLLTANYEPVEATLPDNILELALKIAEQSMSYLPMPAYVLTRNWDIHAWNSHILTLLDWSTEKADRLKSEKKLNILYLIFADEKDDGLRNSLKGSNGTWEEMAFRNIYAFKSVNLLCRHDDWFKEKVNYLCKIPLFAEYWEKVKLGESPLSTEGEAPLLMETEFITELAINNDQSLKFRSLFVSSGSLYYPQVAAYMPLDEKSRQLFRVLGIPVPN